MKNPKFHSIHSYIINFPFRNCSYAESRSFQAVRTSMNHTNSRTQQLNPNERAIARAHRNCVAACEMCRFREIDSMNRES